MLPAPSPVLKEQLGSSMIHRYLLRASKGGKSLIEVDAALDDKFWEDWVTWDVCRKEP